MNIQDSPKDDAGKPAVLSDEALENVPGGIIAILIGLATEQRTKMGDGSVRAISHTGHADQPLPFA